MSVNGIGATGYPAWQGAKKAQQNTAGKSFAESVNNVAGAKGHIVYMKTDDMLYSGGNGSGLSFYIKYAEVQQKMIRPWLLKGLMRMGMSLSRPYISTK